MNSVGRPPRRIPGATWSSLCLMLYDQGVRRVVTLSGLTAPELMALRSLVDAELRKEKER